ncbi:MAG: cysteine--tRNA ligase [Desulfovibrio sp.]|jgi:cysteinyl-tRNA synthetase|nr:cysteine--tRNA ligase [Desulfovibrio sp.]
MLLYNTLGRKKEEFIPVRPGRATMYVCGITAYDFCHIGHARSAVFFDVLARRLRHSGHNLTFVRNFTDVDDKIIARANSEGRDWLEVANTHIAAFHEDMDRLKVLRADFEPRATEYIPQIQEICVTLIAAGKAYATPSGDVYFRVRAWPRYGRLSGRGLDELLAGARVVSGEEKEDPLDFALWKAAKNGEPFWESPWGKGRPGWHIECSAMSAPWLPLDIHGGGQDLIFPHHENEIAQSEAAGNAALANYWIHNGFVQTNAEKMSKSLGNATTIRAMLKNYLPETLRFFILSKHYRSPVDFTQQSMDEAEKALRRVYSALLEASGALARGKWKNSALPENMRREWESLPEAFEVALDDDVNTAQALGQIFSQTRLVNRLLEDKNLRGSEGGRKMLAEFLERAFDWERQLGLFGATPAAFLEELRDIRVRRKNLDRGRIADLLKRREIARAGENFAESDELRDRLAESGVTVRDTREGQIWDLE